MVAKISHILNHSKPVCNILVENTIIDSHTCKKLKNKANSVVQNMNMATRCSNKNTSLIISRKKKNPKQTSTVPWQSFSMKLIK